MNYILTLSIIIISSYLLPAQEFSSKQFQQNTLNKKTNFKTAEINLNKKRFEYFNTIMKNKKLLNNPPITNLTPKQKLDSSERVLVSDTSIRSKNYFTYNEKGKETSYINKNWNDSTKTYFNFSKTETTYDNQSNPVLSVIYTGSEYSWLYDTKSEFSYNLNNKMDSSINYRWFSNQWNPQFKDLPTYDIHGNLILFESFWWDFSMNRWLNSSKTELIYDAKGKLIRETYYYWNDQWIISGRYEYSYNTINLESIRIIQDWDKILGKWLNLYQVTSEYNSKAYPINYTWFIWNSNDNQFVILDKTDINYDVFGNLINSVSSYWLEQNQTWLPYYKEECNYNNQFLFDDLILPIFDINTNLSLPLNESYYGYSYFFHMLNKIATYNYDSGSYANDENFTFYYSVTNITKTVDPSNKEIKIVPNPSNEYITIVTDDNSVLDFKLFDLNGKLIISNKIKSNEVLYTESIKKGIYLYRIISNNNTATTGKLLIE